MSRDPNIRLANDEARCANVHGCGRSDGCARFRAAIPPFGVMDDFSAHAKMIGGCIHFLPIQRGYQAPVQQPVVKGWPTGGTQ